MPVAIVAISLVFASNYYYREFSRPFFSHSFGFFCSLFLQPSPSSVLSLSLVLASVSSLYIESSFSLLLRYSYRRFLFLLLITIIILYIWLRVILTNSTPRDFNSCNSCSFSNSCSICTRESLSLSFFFLNNHDGILALSTKIKK